MSGEEKGLEDYLTGLREEIQVQEMQEILSSVLKDYKTELSTSILLKLSRMRIMKGLGLGGVQLQTVKLLNLYLFSSHGCGLRSSAKLFLNLSRLEMASKECVNELTGGVVELMKTGEGGVVKKKVEYILNLVKVLVKEWPGIFYEFLYLIKIYSGWVWVDVGIGQGLLRGIDQVDTEWFDKILNIGLVKEVAKVANHNWIQRVISAVDAGKLEIDVDLLKVTCGVICSLESDEFDEFISGLMEYLFINWESRRNFKALDFVTDILCVLKSICPVEIVNEMTLIICGLNVPWWIRICVAPVFEGLYLHDVDPLESLENMFEILIPGVAVSEKYKKLKRLNFEDALEYKLCRCYLFEYYKDLDCIESLIEFEENVVKIRRDLDRLDIGVELYIKSVGAS